LRNTRPDDLASTVIVEAIRRAQGLEPSEIDDVVIGCAMPEGPQGLNVARIASFRAGLPESVPAMTLNRFCTSGAETIARGAQAILSEMADVVVAGGTESMSQVPSGGFVMSPNPRLVEERPDVYLTMGLTAENLVQKYNISREDQDAFALRSHQNAIQAIDQGRFKDETVPVVVTENDIGDDGKPRMREIVFDTDEGPRRDTSAQALANLKPAFHVKGTITAGNSSQMSDGAAAVVLMSEQKMNALGLRPLARVVTYQVGGVPPEIMGIGPVEAIPKGLKKAGLSLNDIDLIELNEAFAAQALAVIREAGLPQDIVNVNGGAIALGHPLGCTGAKLALTLIHEMKRRASRYGMVTMCVGGGMGGCLILENVN
jgi:acetyl-CoA acyltransferase